MLYDKVFSATFCHFKIFLHSVTHTNPTLKSTSMKVYPEDSCKPWYTCWATSIQNFLATFYCIEGEYLFSVDSLSFSTQLQFLLCTKTGKCCLSDKYQWFFLSPVYSGNRLQCYLGGRERVSFSLFWGGFYLAVDGVQRLHRYLECT